MNAVAMLGPIVGIAAACDFLDVPRASYYRQHPLLGPALQALTPPLIVAPTLPARALRPDQRQAVRDLLYSQYSSRNDPNGGAEVDQRRPFVAPAYREVAHFPLDPARVAPVATGGGSLIQDFRQHSLMELLPVPRGE